MASAASKKIEKLYAGLGPKEIRRMMAKLAREHKPDEMDRLRRAIPSEHAKTYNDGLKLLRVVNGNALDWIGLSKLGMERDRFRLQAFVREAAIDSVLRYQLMEMWRFIKYPVTESEYRAIVQRERSAPSTLDDYARHLAETEGLDEELRPELEAVFESLPPELEPDYSTLPEDSSEWRKLHDTPEYQAVVQQETERNEEAAKRILAILNTAVEKGELPKPKRQKGELVLPWGVLEDWATGTTEETWELLGPASGEFVPMLRMFHATLGPEWDIRPDSDADFVKEERRQMLQRLPMRPTIPREVRDEIGTLDPPLTEKERQRDWKRLEELQEKWDSLEFITSMMVNAAEVHAEHRAQFEGIREALEIVQRDDFFGEDPLFPEIRAQLDAAQEEADRFPPLWEQANMNWEIRRELYKHQGLEPPDISPLADMDELQEPAPMPTKEPDTTEMLQLLRGWGD